MLVVALWVATACTTPTAAPSPEPSPTAVVVLPSGSPTLTPSVSPVPSPSPTTAPVSAPTSAGAVPDAGILFFSDYGPPEGQLARRVLYRYDGATGTLTRVADGSLAVVGATGIAHDGAAGVYLRGMQGRWDLMRWDGKVASDAEFTACQVSTGHFASWCTVTPSGVGVGYGTHVGIPCGAPQFIRFPGDVGGRPLPADLCIGSAWSSDDGKVVVASGLVRAGAAGPSCTGDLIEFAGTCYRPETWVIPTGGTPRKLEIAGLPGFVGEFVLSPGGTHAAAQHLGSLFLVDLASGRATHLGAAAPSPRWSTEGRLVFVRTIGRESWGGHNVVVATTDGATREVLGYPFDRTKPTGLAPVWDPAGKRLAWVASRESAPPNDAAAAADHLAGRGVGDRRVLVSDLAGEPTEIRCGEGVAEGVRWSHDGTALLLLCRRPGLRVNAFELWMRVFAAPTAVPLVRGLTMGGVDDSGLAPSLLDNTGWSRGLKL